ncbi:hypothetical protein F0562_017552 [Nyssa sinensis]|uniref:Uncharacterized protein n=1 Tax=Nyssa sinensis TaxID=561372 RepID=A0A5J4ZHS3_9ASTE|nr:hypothetical protein F0562_017552 [Nyssa sinensis]
MIPNLSRFDLLIRIDWSSNHIESYDFDNYGGEVQDFIPLTSGIIFKPTHRFANPPKSSGSSKTPVSWSKVSKLVFFLKWLDVKPGLAWGLGICEDHNLVSGRNFGSEDVGPRQLKHMNTNNLRDIPGNYHGAIASGGAASQPLNGGSANIFYNTPSPMATQV